MEDKQLDQFLNSLLDEQRFSATDADWNRFATFKSDEEIKKKKTFPFSWILNGLIVLLAVGGSYAYYHISNSTKHTQINISQTPEKNNIANKDSESNKQIITAPQPITNTVLSTNINKNSLQNPNIYSKQISKNSKTILLQYATNYKIKSKITNEGLAKTTEKKVVIADAKPEIEKENQNSKPLENKLPISINNVVNNNISKSEKIYNPRYLYNKVNENLASKSASKEQKIGEQNEKNAKVKEVEKKEIVQAATTIENKVALQNTINNNVQKEKTESEEILKIDAKKQIYDYDAENANWLLYIHATANINQGLQGNYATHQNWKLAPSFSLDLHRKIGEKTSINLGIGYSYNNALNTQYQKLLSKYYFGRDTANFTIQYSNYHFISIPLCIQYNITNWLQANAGMGITYMMDMKSNLYDKTYGLRTAYGYGTGFNRTDAYSTVGLGVKLSKRFTVNAQYQYGLTDITKNDYFLNTINDKQRRVHLGIAYLITSK